MIWLNIFAALVAVFRLLLILFGLCTILRNLCNNSNTACCTQETRRKFFLGAGVLYLLGLLPHAVVLLLSVPPNPPEMFSFSRYPSNSNDQRDSIICWGQRLTCAFSSGIHVVSCLFCTAEPFLIKLQRTALLKWQRKLLLNAVMLFFVIITTCQSFWLWSDRGLMHWTYTSSQQNGIIEANYDEDNPTEISIMETKQELQIELLFCNESLSSSKVKNYVFFSCVASFSIVIILLITRFITPSVTRLFFGENKQVQEEENMVQTNNLETNGWSQCVCSTNEPQLDGILNFLSFAITSWVLFFRPLTVGIWSLFSDYFIDFGTHFLLTLNVLIPLTATQPSSENSRNWL